MAQRPIRDILERAMDHDDAEKFIALPVLFAPNERNSKYFAESARGAEPALGGQVVERVFATPDGIEVYLSDGTNVSIETNPPTFAMRITKPQERENDGFVKVQLIGHEEELPNTVANAEGRLYTLRQLYAIGLISLEPESYAWKGITPIDLGRIDIEETLPPDQRLLLQSAGEGSLWAIVGTALSKFAKESPRTALVWATSILKGGSKRLTDYTQATVEEKEALADEQAGKARISHAQASKAETEALVFRASLKEAARREQIETESRELDLQKKRFDLHQLKRDDLFHLVEQIDAVPNESLKSMLKEQLDFNISSAFSTASARRIGLPSETGEGSTSSSTDQQVHGSKLGS